VGRTGVCLRTLGGDRPGELRVGRFLRNPRVSVSEMESRARSRLLPRVAGRHVLAIQDTTSLRDDGERKGVCLHPTIAVDEADGALLGLLSADILVRDGKPKEHCNKRELAAKESRRWVDAAAQAADLLAAGASRVTMLADRESDIYEVFACRPEGIDVLVRVHHNRGLTDGGMLHDAGAPLPGSPRLRVDVPTAPNRPAGVAYLSVRVGQIRIKRPKRNHAAEARALPESVELTYVEVYEDQPSPGEEPLRWRLLTTHTATSLDDVRWIVGLYRRRWNIEQVFRVMKTQGFDIEAAPFEDETRPLANLAGATLIAAIHIQQMLHDRDGAAGRPIEDVFDADDRPLIEAIGKTLQGRTARQRNPHPPGLLAHAAWICARLGGWTGYYSKPGPIVLVRGYARLMVMIDGVKRSGLVRIT
jgi:hypothetical protein